MLISGKIFENAAFRGECLLVVRSPAIGSVLRVCPRKSSRSTEIPALQSVCVKWHCQTKSFSSLQ